MLYHTSLIMDGVNEMDLVALECYASELESFRSRVNRYCEALEAGIGNCSRYMLDEGSQKALQKGRQTAENIKACLSHVERLLEKVYRMIQEIEPPREFDKLEGST